VQARDGSARDRSRYRLFPWRLKLRNPASYQSIHRQRHRSNGIDAIESVIKDGETLRMPSLLEFRRSARELHIRSGLIYFAGRKKAKTGV
jgi:hypothetical protein